jgi:hypothetical protein
LGSSISFARALSIIASVALSACSSSESGASAVADGGLTNAEGAAPKPDAGAGAGATGGINFDWSPCRVESEGREAAECANVRLPYRWDVHDGKTVSVFVQHYHPAGKISRGQLWLLQGGPGAWGRDLEAFGPYIAALGPPMDVYVMDQRGTGRSSRLGCAKEEGNDSPGGAAITDEEWPGCLASMQAEWGPRLEGFSVTNTARDLGEMIAALQEPDERVFVYGVSYGTYLTNRYLQLYPAQPTGVILDSICGAACSFTSMDPKFDSVAHGYFDACGSIRPASRSWGRIPGRPQET